MIAQILSLAGPILDKFVEDKDLKTKLNAELKTQLITLDLAQAEANIEQAKHPSIFVSGARPAIMWVCCFALMWQFILAPVLSWGLAIWYPIVELPALDTQALMTLLLSLLGLGGMRTAEKWKGVARSNMK